MAREMADVLHEIEKAGGARENFPPQMLRQVADSLLVDETVVDCLLVNPENNQGMCQLLLITPIRILNVLEEHKVGSWLWSGDRQYRLFAVQLPDVKTIVVSQGSLTVDDVGIYTTLSQEDLAGRRRTQEFGQRLQDHIAKAKLAAGTNQGGASFISELERLAKLRESGAITEEEFSLAERKLLL